MTKKGYIRATTKMIKKRENIHFSNTSGYNNNNNKILKKPLAENDENVNTHGKKGCRAGSLWVCCAMDVEDRRLDKKKPTNKTPKTLAENDENVNTHGKKGGRQGSVLVCGAMDVEVGRLDKKKTHPKKQQKTTRKR